MARSRSFILKPFGITPVHPRFWNGLSRNTSSAGKSCPNLPSPRTHSSKRKVKTTAFQLHCSPDCSCGLVAPLKQAARGAQPALVECSDSRQRFLCLTEQLG